MKSAHSRLELKARRAYREALAILAGRDDITGVDIGVRRVGGKATEEICLRIHVKRKQAASKVGPARIIPKQVHGVRTDVIEAIYHAQATRKTASRSAPASRRGLGRTSQLHSQPIPQPDPRPAPATALRLSDRHDLIRPGISVGNRGAEAGTLGLIVFDAKTGAPCLLSAAHVLAGQHGEIGDAITQPARIDFGQAPRDTIANLLRFFTPGAWGDGAVAKLTDARPFERPQMRSDMLIVDTGIVSMHQVLEKVGRTTGVTRGTVQGIGTYFYAHAPGGMNGFCLAVDGEDDPLREDLSAAGDSGAVWYDPSTRKGYGLQCAGELPSERTELAVAAELPRVLATLKVSLTPPT